MAKKRILIVAEEKLYAKALADTLEAHSHETISATDGHSALNQVEQQAFELVICEENMNSISGLQLLHSIHSIRADLPIILMSDFGTVERAVQAMREGAVDYIVRPIDTDFLLELVERAALKREDSSNDKEDIVAHDPYSIELLQLARKVAANHVSVLISGESGTGKEVLARYIHKHSTRSHEPFVAINCAAIPENMLEAVLFGHEKGAFTGAIQSNAGKFELAQNGTLLLDEISEMPLGLQAKLLRVLQEREVERLGSGKTIELDVRVIATTNRNIKEEVKAGRFREDLYYRLNVFPMQLQPLRNRTADILPLAQQLLKRHAVVGQPVPPLSTDAERSLETYSWPGNVRELANVVQRALVLNNGQEITSADLSFEDDQGIHAQSVQSQLDSGALNSDLKSREFELIIKALRKGDGSRKKAAEQLGISPRTLRYKLAKMRDFGMEIPDA
jgi:two-component system response regulator FlrC